jgi:hypothetical protein
MRARRATALGWLIVGTYAAGLVAVAATAPHRAGRPGDRPGDEAVVEAFVDAWERSRTATFLRSGTFERRSKVTGAVIASEDVLAQRPPRRLHRQLGGVDGRDDDRLVVCPAPPAGEAEADCRLGEPGGPTYAEDVTAELASLRSLFDRRAPVYAVARARDGCFELAQLRSDPRAPFGTESRFCFDDDTGAPSSSRVEYAGGIVEVLAATKLRAEVTEDDLRP